MVLRPTSTVVAGEDPLPSEEDLGQNRPLALITGNSPDLCLFNLKQPLKPQYQSFSSHHNFPLIPVLCNRCRRIGYSIKSNAFSRSYRHMYTLLPSRMYRAIVSCVAKIGSAQEIPLWYADWLTCGSPASSKNSCSQPTMRNSRTSASVDVKVTPQKLSTFRGSFPPPLQTRSRIPVFKTKWSAQIASNS